MKGIILAGGSGNRLYPMTTIMSKQLQPVYDKPMIYYPLSLLMLVGIKDILIISSRRDTPHIESLLGSGEDLGINIEYKVQNAPNGLAEAFIIGEEFIKGDNVTMILGDNLFYGHLDFYKNAIQEQLNNTEKYRAHIFGIHVENPRAFGVLEFDKRTFEVLSIEEKPANPKSNYAIPGMYIFDETAAQRAKEVVPSHRGEIEITSIMQSYLKDGKLKAHIIGRGVTWLDTGTPQHLLEASVLIAGVEKSQGYKVGCIQEIALRMGFIDSTRYENLLKKTPESSYKDYLRSIVNDL